jgi:endonuclease-3 related protein
MPGEPDASPPVHAVYRRLLEHYGPQGWWPLRSLGGRPGFDERGYHPGLHGIPDEDAGRLEVAVGAVLTQNTSWANAERALAALSGRRLMSRDALLTCSEAELAQVIRSSGYFNQKAKKLRWLVRALDGRAGIPSREDLLALWGVGPETADSILLYAYHRPAFVVDAYTRRLVLRLGWIHGQRSYGEVQALLAGGLPREAALYGEYHALIVRHAKEHCRTRPRCAACPLLAAPCTGFRP